MKSISATCLIWFTVNIFGCDEQQDQSISDPDPETIEQTIETDEGTVTGYTSDVEVFPQKIVPINDAASRQFKEWASDAEAFLSTYGKLHSDNKLKQYDHAFKAWQDSTTKKHSDQDVINTLGAYLGQRLVQDLNMEWVMVTDQYGQDYAVRHKTFDLMSFPFSSVSKRIEDREHGFIDGVYQVVKHEIENGELKQRAESEQDEQK